MQDLAAADVGPALPGKWVKINSGSFTMGSPANESCRGSDEVPHQVTLTNSFLIQTTEVTQGQFDAVMGYNPSTMLTLQKCTAAECPVDSLSWHMAAAFCNTLSVKNGLAQCYSCTGSAAAVTCVEAPSSGSSIYNCPGIRLPTEAEWEYAYRASTKTAFYNGDITACTTVDPNASQIGWYTLNASSSTHPVGQKLANSWGLYDMSGNVAEWVNDWYGAVTSTAVIDPTGAPSGKSRLLRGGAWNLYRVTSGRPTAPTCGRPATTPLRSVYAA